VLILSSGDLERILPVEEAVAAVQEAFRLPPDAVSAPLRARVDAGREGTFFVMPALATSLGGFGAKLVGVFPGNRGKGLDSVQAVYALLSTADGRILALLDGNYLTASRTAAVTALATKLLARPGPARLALFGTGTQARFHLAAFGQMVTITEARVCGSSPAKSEAFVRDQAPRYRFPLRAASPDEAVSGADIVCACTTSPTPVFRGELLAPGAHVDAVGAFQPHTRELDDAALGGARIFVDTLEGALAEAGDLLVPLGSGALRREQIVGDLGALVRGEISGRSSETGITIFKSVGCALEDLAAATAAYRKAAQVGAGRQVEL
jgi:ornithine cyclodeaminase